jgi:hypothetical protein
MQANARARLFMCGSAIVIIAILSYPMWCLARFARKEAISFYGSMDVVKVSALVVAIAALIVAWNNFRRGNTAVVKLVSVHFNEIHSVNVNQGQRYSQLLVEMKNIGIPLRRAQVGLIGFTKIGNVSIAFKQLQLDREVADPGDLERGMMAQFGLRSFEMNPGEKCMISSFNEDALRVRIGVYSNGYLVRSFRLQQRFQLIRRYWNKIALAANQRCTTVKERWGRKFVHTPTILPMFPDFNVDLQLFIRSVPPPEMPSGFPVSQSPGRARSEST